MPEGSFFKSIGRKLKGGSKAHKPPDNAPKDQQPPNAQDVLAETKRSNGELLERVRQNPEPLRITYYDMVKIHRDLEVNLTTLEFRQVRLPFDQNPPDLAAQYSLAVASAQKSCEKVAELFKEFDNKYGECAEPIPDDVLKTMVMKVQTAIDEAVIATRQYNTYITKMAEKYAKSAIAEEMKEEGNESLRILLDKLHEADGILAGDIRHIVGRKAVLDVPPEIPE